MRGWWQEISGLVLPAACGGCGVPRTLLCPECAYELYGSAARVARPDPAPPGLPVVHAAAPYADAVRAVLLAHKERGALGLARPLGIALAGAVRAAVRSAPASRDRPLLLVPVPSARWAVRARGHDATRRTALAAARELRRTGTAAGVLPLLRQRRPVTDQTGLTAPERVANLAGALRAAEGAGRLLTGATVVLVDDLMTTGASLTEAARAVGEAAGAGGGGGPRGAAVGAGAGVFVAAAVVAAPSISFSKKPEPDQCGKRCSQ
ncbi:ComF family protein [Streptomyces tsukubensis]|uniref:ComF family protein n=1 Tax=Streptomyces tsukubensis TaxID=83656 RepID=UPI0012A07769|nr:ComF family protein [Streptomyces tsukubensis]AZK94322.1 phosphoribosyltransferase [Streptomyces tsukubensis]